MWSRISWEPVCDVITLWRPGEKSDHCVTTDCRISAGAIMGHHGLHDWGTWDSYGIRRTITTGRGELACHGFLSAAESQRSS